MTVDTQLQIALQNPLFRAVSLCVCVNSAIDRGAWREGLETLPLPVSLCGCGCPTVLLYVSLLFEFQMPSSFADGCTHEDANALIHIHVHVQSSCSTQPGQHEACMCEYCPGCALKTGIKLYAVSY